MTTVLCDIHLGVMVADSGITDGNRQWSARKVWRIDGTLLGFCGQIAEASNFIDWFKCGRVGLLTRFANSECLMMSSKGVFHFIGEDPPTVVTRGREAIGSGSKAAMCAYEALAWQDPKRAVLLACKHDAASRTPVRLYKL